MSQSAEEYEPGSLLLDTKVISIDLVSVAQCAAGRGSNFCRDSSNESKARMSRYRWSHRDRRPVSHPKCRIPTDDPGNQRQVSGQKYRNKSSAVTMAILKKKNNKGFAEAGLLSETRPPSATMLSEGLQGKVRELLGHAGDEEKTSRFLLGPLEGILQRPWGDPAGTPLPREHAVSGWTFYPVLCEVSARNVGLGSLEVDWLVNYICLRVFEKELEQLFLFAEP